MSNPTPHTPGHSPGAQRGSVPLLERLGWGLVARVYALVLIAIVLWLSWLAIRYLAVALLFPTPPPPQIVSLPLRAAQALRSPDTPAFEGSSAVENPRAPLGHYHRVGNWFQPDRANDCTRAGCHAPLPHGKNKADRAFLNMHATSIHCGVCHMQTEKKPLLLTWYDLESGRPIHPPALLAAFAAVHAMQSQTAAQWTTDQQHEITRLLTVAAQAAGGDPELARLAEHFAAARVDGEEFPRLLEETGAVVPRHFRGEYGAKLALVDPATGKPRLSHPGNQAAVAEFLSKKDALQGTARDVVLERVHPQRRNPTLNCTDCHKATGSLVDFAAVGYPPARVQQLLHPTLMQAIEHIVRGEEFHMPGFMSPLGGAESKPE